jgi:hypothetical protein
MKKKRYILVGILFLLTITSVDAILGNDAGLTLTLNPNITNYVTNNYTTINNTYMGGFIPHAPWLYNDTTDIYFNYSRLIFEFYNSSQVDALLNAQDECSEITGCVVGALTSESDPRWSGNATAALNQTANNVECNDCVTAGDIGSIGACSNICTDSAYNASYLTSYTETDPLWSGNATNALLTYNATYHGYWSINFTNRSNFWDDIDVPPGSWTDTYNVTYHAKWDECSDASGCGWLTSYTETDPLWSGNATAALSTYNITYAATSADVTANRTAWLNNCYNTTYESTYNSTYAAKQNDIGSNCDADNYAYGVQDDGTLLCRADQVGGGGAAGDKWVDGGDYIYPNASFADNAFIMGWIKAYNWTNVSITESQITDFGTYLESESDPRWQGNSSLVVYTSQTSAWDKDSTDDITTANIASQNVNRSNYWDNYDTPPSTWTDTYNLTYHNYWQLNSSNMSYYWGNFKVSSGACSNVCTDADTWNTTQQMYNACNNGTFAPIAEPLWSGNATAALTGNTTQQMYNACNNGTFALISEPRWAGNATAALTGNTTEEMQDAAGTMATTGSGVSLTYNDGANTLTTAITTLSSNWNAGNYNITAQSFNSTNTIFVPQNYRICAYNASGPCVQWILFNSSGVYIQG